MQLRDGASRRLSVIHVLQAETCAKLLPERWRLQQFWMHDHRPRVGQPEQEFEYRAFVQSLQLARRMEGDVLKPVEIQTRNRVNEQRQLVIPQSRKLHGVNPRHIALDRQPCSEIALGQCACREPNWLHQNTPKSRISIGNRGCTSKNRRVTPRRKRWLTSRSPA